MDLAHCVREMTVVTRRGDRSSGIVDVALLVLSETRMGAALLEDMEKARISIHGDSRLGRGAVYLPAKRKLLLSLRGRSPVGLAMEIAQKGMRALLAERRGTYPLVDALDRGHVDETLLSAHSCESLKKVLGRWPLRTTWTGFSIKDGLAHALAVASASGMTAIAVGMELAEKGRMAGVKLLRHSGVASHFSVLMSSGAVRSHGVKAWRQGAGEACLPGFLSCTACLGRAADLFMEGYGREGKPRREVVRDHLLLEMRNGGFVPLAADGLDGIGILPGDVLLFKGEPACRQFSAAAAACAEKNPDVKRFFEDFQSFSEAERPDIGKLLASGSSGHMASSAPAPHMAGDSALPGQARGQKGREK